eukprot:41766-Amphidinium_carterae.1
MERNRMQTSLALTCSLCLSTCAACLHHGRHLLHHMLVVLWRAVAMRDCQSPAAAGKCSTLQEQPRVMHDFRVAAQGNSLHGLLGKVNKNCTRGCAYNN